MPATKCFRRNRKKRAAWRRPKCRRRHLNHRRLLPEHSGGPLYPAYVRRISDAIGAVIVTSFLLRPLGVAEFRAICGSVGGAYDLTKLRRKHGREEETRSERHDLAEQLQHLGSHCLLARRPGIERRGLHRRWRLLSGP